MSLEELDRLFHDPAHRCWGVFYSCAADPRLIAPSRPTMQGWQINFAHPRAFPCLLLYLSILVGPVAVVTLFASEDPLGWAILAVGAFAGSVAFLIRLSTRLSRQIGVDPQASTRGGDAKE